ncbi:hypothetical protein SSP35_01_03810 [Streptomyces sp. NBRC 110611]|nr:hypothetical protein SSP35_01_03810 [Streptomyces sp. NBRC 110611]
MRGDPLGPVAAGAAAEQHGQCLVGGERVEAVQAERLGAGPERGGAAELRRYAPPGGLRAGQRCRPGGRGIAGQRGLLGRIERM